MALFGKMGVLSRTELEARFTVMNETYVKKLQIEARVIGDLCLNHIIPAAVKYQQLLGSSLDGMWKMFSEESPSLCRAEIATLRRISQGINYLSDHVAELVEARKKANREPDTPLRARLYCHEVRPLMDRVRADADALEMLVDDELWPLPKYRELLFLQ